jgi:hypothetical protein
MHASIIRLAQALGRQAAIEDDAMKQRGVQCASPPTADTPATCRIRAVSPTSNGNYTNLLDPEVGTWWPIFQTQPPLAAVYMGDRVWQIVSPEDDPALSPASLWNRSTGSRGP